MSRRWFAACLVAAACTATTPADPPDVAGSWVRPVSGGTETLVLSPDGTFAFAAPRPALPIGPDVQHVTGTYAIGERDPHFSDDDLMFSIDGPADHFLARTMLLRGTTADRHSLDARFTFAVDGDQLVRGATVHDLDTPTDWVGVEDTVIDGDPADGDVLSWWLQQDPGSHSFQFLVQYLPGMTWDGTDGWSGTWTETGDQTTFHGDLAADFTEVAVGTDARRDLDEDHGQRGLVPSQAGYGATYKRATP